MKSVTNWKVDPFHVKRNGHDDGLRLSSVTVTVAGPEDVAAWGTSAWTVPEGHRTRITSAEARAPRPKRISAGAAAGTAADDSNLWRRLPARPSIFVPAPVGLLCCASSRTRTERSRLPPSLRHTRNAPVVRRTR